MGQMNRSLNLPQIQKIMNDFEKESATMDMKEDMMSEAVDDAMDDEAEGEGEEEEGDRILKEVLDEIGVGLGQSVSASERCVVGIDLDRLPGSERVAEYVVRFGSVRCEGVVTRSILIGTFSSQAPDSLLTVKPDWRELSSLYQFTTVCAKQRWWGLQFS